MKDKILSISTIVLLILLCITNLIVIGRLTDLSEMIRVGIINQNTNEFKTTEEREQDYEDYTFAHEFDDDYGYLIPDDEDPIFTLYENEDMSTSDNSSSENYQISMFVDTSTDTEYLIIKDKDTGSISVVERRKVEQR